MLLAPPLLLSLALVGPPLPPGSAGLHRPGRDLGPAHLADPAGPTVAGSLSPAAGRLQAMQSPWWENYDRKDRYLCDNRFSLVVERNSSQATLISANGHSLLFRDSSHEGSDLDYHNDEVRILLRGDELTLERKPLRFTCVRTDQV